MRGLYDQDDVSAEGLRKRVRLIFHAGERFMTPEANARAAAEHEVWAQQNDGEPRYSPVTVRSTLV